MKPAKLEWQMHESVAGRWYIPSHVKDNVRIEVQYRNGARRISDDFMHEDLWKPEKAGHNPLFPEVVPYGGYDIVMWRLV